MKEIFFIIVVLLLFAGCKKAKPDVEESPVNTTAMKRGLPDDPTKIHGYLLLCYRNDIIYNHIKQVRFYATFSDPCKNLIKSFDKRNFQINVPGSGNVDVGTVSFAQYANASYTMVPNVLYSVAQYTTALPSIPHNPQVSIDGNSSFKPFNLVIETPFPAITDSIILTNWVHRDTCIFKIGKYVRGCDSVTVYLRNNMADKTIRKSTVYSENLIIKFSQSDLSALGNNNIILDIIIQAANYSTCTIENKVYCFEQTMQFERDFILYE